jgi:hypothetical protein
VKINENMSKIQVWPSNNPIVNIAADDIIGKKWLR